MSFEDSPLTLDSSFDSESPDPFPKVVKTKIDKVVKTKIEGGGGGVGSGLKRAVNIVRNDIPTNNTEINRSRSSSKRFIPESIKIKASVLTSEDIIKSNGEQSITLSEAQHRVIQRLMKRENTFFTGAAGTGKSYCVQILESILKKLNKTKIVARTAPTGVAACNINGMTIHSWAGIGLGNETVHNYHKKINGYSGKATKERWLTTEILVIDEISMLNADLFEKINELGKLVRSDTRPFGGIQVIMCGDFFQLPPVASRGDKPRFCFESPSWDEVLGKHGSIVLDKVFRQKDGPFVRILNSMRRGIITNEAQKILQQKVKDTATAKAAAEIAAKLKSSKSRNSSELREHGVSCESPQTQNSIISLAPGDIKPTVLFSRNNDCDSYNSRELNKLPLINVDECDNEIESDEGKIFEFKAIDKGKVEFLKGIKAPELLELRVGAQVMLLKNLDQILFFDFLKVMAL